MAEQGLAQRIEATLADALAEAQNGNPGAAVMHAHIACEIWDDAPEGDKEDA